MATKHSRTVEELEQLYTAFNQGDIETVVNAMTDDITWIEAEGEPYGGTYRGPNEVLQMFKRIPEDFDHYAVTPSRFIVKDDMVVVEGSSDVTSKDEVDYEIPFAHVWRLDGDKIQEFRQYTDTVLLQEAFKS